MKEQLPLRPDAPAKRGRPAADHTTEHTRLVDRIRLRLGRQRDLVIWSNPVKLLDALSSEGSTDSPEPGFRSRLGPCSPMGS